MNTLLPIIFYITLLYMIIDSLKDGYIGFALIFFLIGLLPFTH